METTLKLHGNCMEATWKLSRNYPETPHEVPKEVLPAWQGFGLGPRMSSLVGSALAHKAMTRAHTRLGDERCPRSCRGAGTVQGGSARGGHAAGGVLRYRYFMIFL